MKFPQLLALCVGGMIGNQTPEGPILTKTGTTSSSLQRPLWPVSRFSRLGGRLRLRVKSGVSDDARNVGSRKYTGRNVAKCGLWPSGISTLPTR